MTNEELLKKDWQLLSAHAHLHTLAKLDTILQNQAVIISHFEDVPLKDVSKQMHDFEHENYEKIVEKIASTIPDYPLIERTYTKV